MCNNTKMLNFSPEYQDEFVYEGYVTPWARCQPYIIGIGLGFVLHITKGKNVKISKVC